MGTGSVHVSLLAGIYQVEAQEVNTCEPLIVEVRPHETIELLYLEELGYNQVVFTQRKEGSPNLKSNFHLFNFAVGTALICCAPLGIGSAFQLEDTQAQWILGISIAWILIVLAYTP